MNIKLSVLVLAYNHEAYIRKALDSILMQKTDFLYEILVHDDASTDGTDKIIKEYQNRFPNIIKPFFQTENQFRKGIAFDREFLWKNIKGQYVALCEGDDYWTDELKLQKQVNYLDSNKDCTICFHPVQVIWEGRSKRKNYVFQSNKECKRKNFSFDELKRRNFIKTNSVVYRWVLKGRENLFPDGILPGDWFLHLLHAREGKIFMLDDIMAVYRRIPGSLWDMKGDIFYLRNGVPHLRFFEAVRKEFGWYNDKMANDIVLRTFSAFMKNRLFGRVNELLNEFPELSENIVNNMMVNNTVEEVFFDKKKHRKITRVLVYLIIFVFFLVFVLLLS